MFGVLSIFKVLLVVSLVRLIASVLIGVIVYCAVLLSIYRFYEVGAAYFLKYLTLRKLAEPTLNK